jgi:hypothetical protein
MPRTAHRAFAASLMLACIPLPAAVAMAVAATVVARRLAATVAAPLPVAMAAVPLLPGIKPTIPKQRPQAPRTSLRAAHVPICHAHTQILEQRWGRRGRQRQRCCCRASLLDPPPTPDAPPHSPFPFCSSPARLLPCLRPPCSRISLFRAAPSLFRPPAPSRTDICCAADAARPLPARTLI